MESKDKANGQIELSPTVTGETKTETTSENANLVDRDSKLTLATAQKLRLATLIVSWLSVILLGTLGVVALVVSVRQGSSALFAFSLDAILDCLSSIVVIWRYSGSAATLYSVKKEKTACVALGILFIVSAIGIITKAAIALAHSSSPENNTLEFYLVLVNIVLCLGFVISKIFLAVKLQSISIGTDAVNSGIGFVLATTTLISMHLHENHPNISYLDHVFGIVCSLVLIVYGIWVIVYELRIINHRSPEESKTRTDMYTESRN